MSQIDEELARAAKGEPDATSPVVAPRRTEAPKKGNVGLLAALLVIGAGLVGLVMTFKEDMVYAKTVDQLLASQQKLAGRAVRVQGDLVKGSLVHQDQPCEYRFKISRNGAEVPVRYPQCVVPDTFKDMPGMNVEVTVEGKLDPSGQFEATQVMAKCPSKYEMKQRASQGESAPHSPM